MMCPTANNKGNKKLATTQRQFIDTRATHFIYFHHRRYISITFLMGARCLLLLALRPRCRAIEGEFWKAGKRWYYDPGLINDPI